MPFSAIFQDSVSIVIAEFDEWQFAMNRLRDKYQSGSISAKQFLAWLEEYKTYTEDWDYEEKLYMMRKTTRRTIVWFSFSDMVYATIFWISLTLFASYNIIKNNIRSKQSITINYLH